MPTQTHPYPKFLGYSALVTSDPETALDLAMAEGPAQ
jgi:hypothetical protein